MNAKKVLIYITIAVLTIGLFMTGLGFVVKIVQRDHAIVTNRADVKNLENEFKSLKREVKELRKIIVRMDKQLVAVSTHFNIAIIQDD